MLTVTFFNFLQDHMVKCVINPKFKNNSSKKQNLVEDSVIENYKNLMSIQNKNLEEYKKKLADVEELHLHEVYIIFRI